LDFPQSFVQSTQIAEGIWHLTGSSHHSLVVEQADRLVVIEGPMVPERGDALLAHIAAEISDKPVAYVVATHHHEDHTAGLRSFVAAGATLVAHEAAEPFYAEVMARPSTVRPDTLANTADITPVIEVVTADGFTIDDADRPVQIYHLDTVHANDMLLVVATSTDGEVVAFESDLFNPSVPETGAPGVALVAEWAAEALAGIDAAAEDVTIVAGGHGGAQPVQELRDYVNPPVAP